MTHITEPKESLFWGHSYLNFFVAYNWAKNKDIWKKHLNLYKVIFLTETKFRRISSVFKGNKLYVPTFVLFVYTIKSIFIVHLININWLHPMSQEL